MGIKHFLLLLIYLDPLNVLCTSTAKRTKPVPKRSQKPKELNNTSSPPTSTQRSAQVQLPAAGTHETCLGYYDVSGQFDKEFECNNTDHRYCCGSCFLRFCCQFKVNRLNQRTCKNYNKPDWVKTVSPSPAPTGDTYDPSMDQTNTAVYITCGVIAFIIVVGVSTKVAYDKATQPPQEMNIHRALADILRQQGPIPISQYNCENFAAMNSSSKDNTPQRTGSKNHYTPVHASKSNHGGHYPKEGVRGGGHDLHNFISSGFVTLGRGQVKVASLEDSPPSDGKKEASALSTTACSPARGGNTGYFYPCFLKYEEGRAWCHSRLVVEPETAACLLDTNAAPCHRANVRRYALGKKSHAICAVDCSTAASPRPRACGVYRVTRRRRNQQPCVPHHLLGLAAWLRCGLELETNKAAAVICK
ncbi:hypothetical protein P4O66_001434 [Electrophorus voltai]|uniref:Shisa N-terminal domain-containing protein n=1 Tax=Electrophorus voltai TaxID=2609070 RepID=A0AAD8Z9P5_9TELE|nr:hypothetical protein P4O66_001434 [Electrophorus voltai]